MSLVQPPPQSPPGPQQQYAAASPTPNSSSAASPPASSRRPATRADNNASLPSSPQQSQYNPAMMSTPRGQSATGVPSPGATMNTSTYTQFYPDAGAATALPIRTTSSHQTSPTYGTPAATYDTRGYSSRPSPAQAQTPAGYGSGSESERRQGPRSPREEQQPGSGRSQRTRNAPSSSRSATAIGQPPMGTDLPRENSAVLNRIVVDDPQADLAREEARKAEARGASPQAADAAPVQRSRQEHLKHSSSQNRKEVKFGDYILGQTIGEGEFGKVKMGWKRDSTVQVAIKLIKKETLAGNTTRLPKIYREIHILRELNHPNIVRLHEFVETERHMGIILEYASGGELFDYILNHRYLKDPAARRLFAQLVSGVGYLHKKGIVHRDLKLENLLLDRNKHIIITDFGFANTFNPADELGDEVENRISDKDFIKRQGLDKVIPWRDGRDGGHRRGDLMQTSCGSPCYAAPELVVSDGLYTGRKVDVWSCGVILYAMLAGYLPFDDDPANPEGDNINLLYKYIVSTPLTFPEYVTPHARDLLRRILVPDPRRRADLFEVARHSWLSEYTNVVGFIGSRVKSDANASPQDGEEIALGRSSSVREPASRANADRSSVAAPKHTATASIGGDEASDIRKQQRDAKRRTVQVEYVAPNMATARQDLTSDPNPRKSVPGAAPSATKTRARTEAQGPVEVTPSRGQDGSMLPPSRQQHQQRAISESTNIYGTSAGSSTSRPNTSGALGASSRLPSRGNSYSQPSAAQPTTTTAQGRISQPKSGPGYIISGGPVSSETGAVDPVNRPVSEQARTGRQFQAPQTSHQQGKPSGHKRSSTLGSLADKMMNRSGSKRITQQQQQQDTVQSASEKRNRKYPPVSMKNAIPNSEVESTPRPSTDSRRPSFGFNRKASREQEPSISGKRGSRRFSWLPGSLSMGSFTGKKEQGYDSAGDDGYRPPGTQQSQLSQMSQQSRQGRPPSKGMAFARGHSDSPANSASALYYEEDRERPKHRNTASQARYDKELPPSPGPHGGPVTFPSPPPVQRKQFRDDGYGNNLIQNEPVERFYTPSQEPQTEQYMIGGNGDWEQYEPEEHMAQRRDQSLRPHKRMGEAYDHGSGGSSSATRRVMDFFRRRGKEREM